MEVLAGVSSVIAVVSLAGQVIEGCSYLRGVFDDARAAPKALRQLSKELGIIQRLVHNAPDADSHHGELDFCKEKLEDLRAVVEKYGVFESVGGRKK